jgi:hypothetical protein
MIVYTWMQLLLHLVTCMMLGGMTEDEYYNMLSTQAAASAQELNSSSQAAGGLPDKARVRFDNSAIVHPDVTVIGASSAQGSNARNQHPSNQSNQPQQASQPQLQVQAQAHITQTQSQLQSQVPLQLPFLHEKHFSESSIHSGGTTGTGSRGEGSVGGGYRRERFSSSSLLMSPARFLTPLTILRTTLPATGVFNGRLDVPVLAVVILANEFIDKVSFFMGFLKDSLSVVHTGLIYFRLVLRPPFRGTYAILYCHTSILNDV